MSAEKIHLLQHGSVDSGSVYHWLREISSGHDSHTAYQITEAATDTSIPSIIVSRFYFSPDTTGLPERDEMTVMWTGDKKNPENIVGIVPLNSPSEDMLLAYPFEIESVMQFMHDLAVNGLFEGIIDSNLGVPEIVVNRMPGETRELWPAIRFSKKIQNSTDLGVMTSQLSKITILFEREIEKALTGENVAEEIPLEN